MNNQTSQLEMKLRKKNVSDESNVKLDTFDSKDFIDRFSKAIAFFNECDRKYDSYSSNWNNHIKDSYSRVDKSCMPKNPTELNIATRMIDSRTSTIARSLQFVFEDLVKKGYRSFITEIDFRVTDELSRDKNLELTYIIAHNTLNALIYNSKVRVISNQQCFWPSIYNCDVDVFGTAATISYHAFNDSNVVFHDKCIIFPTGVNSNITLKKDHSLFQVDEDRYAPMNCIYNIYHRKTFDKVLKIVDKCRNISLSHEHVVNYKTKDVKIEKLERKPGQPDQRYLHTVQNPRPNVVNFIKKGEIIETHSVKWWKE
ncbi:MAG TPA: hypothetical protein VEC16_02290 [Alphaproteobacteria bacterium]|nr:hypothetical protein [Alphaproteobacteria bacterium]